MSQKWIQAKQTDREVDMQRGKPLFVCKRPHDNDRVVL